MTTLSFDEIAFAIDPGLNHAGWGVVARRGSNLIHLDSGVINLDHSIELGEKLVRIHQLITNYIQLYQPSSFAIEDTYVNNNAMSSLKLGQARGVAILAAAQAGLKIHEYAPRFVKKAIVGNGNAEKEQMMAMVSRLLAQNITNHNQADALAIAICHINCHKFYNQIIK